MTNYIVITEKEVEFLEKINSHCNKFVIIDN